MKNYKPQRTEKSPLMLGWEKLKAEHPDSLIAIRIGDFVEFFFDDAIKVASILKIALTKRRDVPMAGIPFHAMESYLAKLAVLHRIAIAGHEDGEWKILETR